ncbi:TonB family protein [Candidatus Methylomirabilis sp.]|uniref:energy transducer TonB n=1 Tax=Candidatus Methylomirabilis sp. TaxID=2032687 RepID=UPI002A5F4C29|nr:TonB family protein [Candidatus Methylomirabilis sp.]
MAPKDSFTLGRQGGHTAVGRAPDAVHPAMALLVESRTGPLPLGRFLLSSTGFHLILAWAVISFGLPVTPSVPRPLVVTIIGSENSESSAPSGPLVHTRTKQPAGAAGPKQASQPHIVSSQPSEVARPLSTAEAPVTLDERIGGPKAVGISNSGSHAVGAGTPGAFAAGSLSPGPVLLSSDGDGAIGSGSARRGGAGRLDAALAAPLTPSVTIGSPQGKAGGGVGWAGNGGAGGGFAAPNYGINPLPKYPLLAREKGYEGTVYLRVLVQVNGRVGQLAVDRTSGYEILDRAAVDSVKEWAFFPAKKGGRLVESWVLLPVKFALN